MKKWWSIALVCAIAAGGVGCSKGSSNQPQPNVVPTGANAPGIQADTRSRLYLSLGDSVALGTGAKDGDADAPAKNGFFALLSDYVSKRDSRFERKNLGVSGITTAQMVDYLDKHAEEIKKADLITLEIGGNDVIAALNTWIVQKKDTSEEMVSAYREHLPKVLAKLRSLNPEAPIYIADNYNPVGDESNSYYMAAQHWVGRLNQVIYDAAPAHNVKVARVSQKFVGVKDATWWTKIDPHPTNKGHEFIRDAFWEAILVNQPNWQYEGANVEAVAVQDIVTRYFYTNAKAVTSNQPQDWDAVLAMASGEEKSHVEQVREQLGKKRLEGSTYTSTMGLVDLKIDGNVYFDLQPDKAVLGVTVTDFSGFNSDIRTRIVPAYVYLQKVDRKWIITDVVSSK